MSSLIIHFLPSVTASLTEEQAAEYTKECVLEQLKQGKIPLVTLTATSTRKCVIGKFMDNAPKHVIEAVDLVVGMVFDRMPDAFEGIPGMDKIPGIGGDIKLPGGFGF